MDLVKIIEEKRHAFRVRVNEEPTTVWVGPCEALELHKFLHEHIFYRSAERPDYLRKDGGLVFMNLNVMRSLEPGVHVGLTL